MLQDGLSKEAMAHALVIQNWLIGEARFIDDPDVAIKGLVGHLHDAGVPLDRLSSAIPTLYAVRSGLGRSWTREDGISTQDFPWDLQEVYEASPYYQAHQTRDWVRFRLDETDDDAFGIVAELRASGYTDYICMPVFFRDGTDGGLTYATRRPEGFSAEDIAIFRIIESAIAMVLELNRVSIRSAIVFIDMRSFTALSASMSAEETVTLLNRYFDCVVPPIEERIGQVLKYIGDGVLAIYRADDDPQGACVRALHAAEEIIKRVKQDQTRGDAQPPFDVKVALHFGEVAYGNIGSGARLDYTVVGRGVNLASRLADLSGQLDRHVLVSSDFAALLPSVPFEEMGTHELRGVAEPQRVFAPTS